MGTYIRIGIPENKDVVGNALLTVATSTIKYDEHWAPKRAKWRLLALGNLGPHDWSTHQFFQC